MKKIKSLIAAVFMSIFLLTGCLEVKEVPEAPPDSGFKVACLDGVQYWMRDQYSNHALMAVRIDPKTLQPKRCN